jgi:hypothetical protein
MNATRDVLAGEKRLLLARSSLNRLQLRRSAENLRGSLPWSSAKVVTFATPGLRRIAFDVVSSMVGLGRTALLVRTAGRVVRFSRIAAVVIAYFRSDRAGPARGIDS